MIRSIAENELDECVRVIRESFATVAAEFGFTAENAPRFTAFATTKDRLRWHLSGEHRKMFAFFKDGQIVGYYSFLPLNDGKCELSNLCVLPEHRHSGIGAKLLTHAFSLAKNAGYHTMQIGIVEENAVLKQWYASFGFVHTGTQKFDFFPFTCGYMEKYL